MNKKEKDTIKIAINLHHKHIERWLIIILLCGNLVSDNDARTEKPRLGQITDIASQCEVVSSLKRM